MEKDNNQSFSKVTVLCVACGAKRHKPRTTQGLLKSLALTQSSVEKCKSTLEMEVQHDLEMELERRCSHYDCDFLDRLSGAALHNPS